MIASSLSQRLKAMEEADLDLEDFVVTVWMGEAPHETYAEGRAHRVAIDHDDTGLTRTIVVVENDAKTILVPESRVSRVDIYEDAQ